MDEKLQAMEKLIQENEARLKVVEAQKVAV